MFQQFGARLVAEESVQQPLLIEHHTGVEASITTAPVQHLSQVEQTTSQSDEHDGGSFYEFFRH